MPPIKLHDVLRMEEAVTRPITNTVKEGDPYERNGPEATAIHDAIAYQHRDGGGFFDCGTYFEAARDALVRLEERGFSVIENQRLEADRDALICAYGLLWMVHTDDWRIHRARKALLSRMTKEMQKEGITLARKMKP